VRECVFSYFKEHEASGRTAASIERARCGLLRNLARRSSDEITYCQIGGRHPARGIAGAASTFAGTANKDVINTALAAGQFKTLTTAINAAGLTATLEGPGPFTVFAPTDAA